MYHVELNPFPLYSEDSYEQIQNITPWTGKVTNMTRFKNLSKNPWLTNDEKNKTFEYDNDGDDVYFNYNTASRTNYFLLNKNNKPSSQILGQDNNSYMNAEFVDPSYDSYYAKNDYGSSLNAGMNIRRKAGKLINENVYRKKVPKYQPIEKMIFLNPYTGHHELNPKFVISPYGDTDNYKYKNK